jgi:hypothetical protein
LGVEIARQTAQTVGGSSDTFFNVGTIFDFSEHHHLLFSAGQTLQGQGSFQAYIAFQFTFGPESKKEK